MTSRSALSHIFAFHLNNASTEPHAPLAVQFDVLRCGLQPPKGFKLRWNVRDRDGKVRSLQRPVPNRTSLSSTCNPRTIFLISISISFFFFSFLFFAFGFPKMLNLAIAAEVLAMVETHSRKSLECDELCVLKIELRSNELTAPSETKALAPRRAWTALRTDQRIVLPLQFPGK